MANYKAILLNDQGACLAEKNCNTIEEIRNLLNEYSDPENIDLRVLEDHEEVEIGWYIDNGFMEDYEEN